ncbi:Fur family transcriptional regulator [Mucilaginibacter sp. UYCu711]|uniref:Fur family transcriptional regulator n=1 Tax=Mucilaginibacter sp. UYCu711 TaxID=3156339 RepID=UPI003D20BAF6
MTNNQAKRLLKQHLLKVTGLRIGLLKVLATCQTAITRVQLETSQELVCDRVTLYRLLKTFERRRLIHKLLDKQGKASYTLNNYSFKGDSVRQPASLHFNCTVCRAIYRLDKVEIPVMKVPLDYELESLNITATGICPVCNTE